MMPKVDALEYGVGLVEHMAGAGTPDSTSERVHAALAVARFLAERDYYDDPDDDDDYDPDDPDDNPTGPVLVTTPEQTDIVTEEVSLLSRVGERGGQKVVGIFARRGSVTVHVPVSPMAARKFAAGVLNDADQADGTPGLNFVAEAA